MRLFYKYTLIFFLFGVGVLLISTATFYVQFENSLLERTKEQLKSINSLKRNYVESLINNKVDELQDFGLKFNPNKNLEEQLPSLSKENIELIEGRKKLFPKVVNIEEYKQGILLSYPINDTLRLERLIPIESFQKVLLQRIGMGTTGESYIVGEDYKMRTQSRFISNSIPSKITVNTKGTRTALKGKEGTGLFPDYRGVPVLSAFSKMEFGNIRWVILSEIDESEAIKPLNKLKNRSIFIIIIILILVSIKSLLLSRQLIHRIVSTKTIIQKLAKGEIPQKPEINVIKDEIDTILDAICHLIDSFDEAIKFAKSISKGDFNAQYTLQSNNDKLGLSLIDMQKKLKALTEETEALEIIGKRSLIEGQEQERARLAKDIHDGIGPLLTTIKLQLEGKNSNSNEAIEKVKQKLDETISEIRNISFNLMPPVLLDFGVGAAVKHLLDSVKGDIDITFINDIISDTKLTDDINIAIYRITQECLNNSLKHADPGEIKVSITEFANKVCLFYSDDGIGFDLEKYNKNKKDSKGLINIQERVKVLNGNITIQSDMTGTTLEIEIPFES